MRQVQAMVLGVAAVVACAAFAAGQSVQSLLPADAAAAFTFNDGAKGTFTTRGFLGDYEIQVVAGGKTRTVKASLGRDGRTVECVLE